MEVLVCGKILFDRDDFENIGCDCDSHCGHVCCDESECDDCSFIDCLMALSNY